MNEAVRRQVIDYRLLCMLVGIIFLVGCARVDPKAPAPTPTLLQERDIQPTYVMPDSVADLTGYLRLHGSDAQTSAARKLAGMGPKASEAVPALASVLFVKDTLPEAHEAAMQALGEIGPSSKQAVPIIITVLLTDRNARVRQSAATALWGIQDKSSIFALVQSLDDKDPGVSLIAAGVISNFAGEEFAGGNNLDDKGVPLMVNEAKVWWREKGQYMNWIMDR